MTDYNLITLSYPTMGEPGEEIPAATHSFFTTDYRPPRRPRALGSDVVQNRDGKFKYIYDNGPSYLEWQPFRLTLDDSFLRVVGSATVQWNNLLSLWEHVGPLTMKAPDGIYQVHWAQEGMSTNFRSFPGKAGDKIEYLVDVQFNEAD